jgi:coenzyme PQQ precursor peptide PqqA
MPAGGQCGPRGNDSPMKENVMTWETPCAIDLRFGMEITMYISNR